MTISIEKDIDISYVDGAGQVGQQLQKNNLVYLDDLAKTSKNTPFCVYISDLRSLEGYAQQGTNPRVFNFLNMFLKQPIRPAGFWYCAVAANGSSGYLQTGNLDDWDTFIAKFKSADNPEIFLPLAFKTSTGSAATNNPFMIAGDALYDVTNYASLIAILAAQNTENIITTIIGNAINFSTVAVGPTEGVIDYLAPDDSAVDQGAKLLTGILGTWDEFLAARPDLNALNLTLKTQGGDNIFAYENVAYRDLTSWTAFAEALNTLSAAMVKVRYMSTNKLLFMTTAVGVAQTIGYATSTDDPNTAQGLKASSAEDGAVLIQGASVAATINAAEALKGLQTSPGVEKVAGKGDIHSSPEYMRAFMAELSKASASPNCVCLSRYLTLADSGLTDVDTTKSLITGFNTYFSPLGDSAPTTCSLWISTNIYDDDSGEAVSNIWADILGTANSRNIVLVYQSNQEEYAEGAVATWGAAINWEGSNVVRNAKGLDLPEVTADPNIDNDLNDKLTEYHINFYGKMSNGMNMFREGLTCYTGDMGKIFIDTMLGINAIQLDMKDALIRALKTGTTLLNSEGTAKIFSVLANVCQKYVTNGFLTAGSYTKVIDGQLKTIIVNPYRIEISRIFNDAQITSRIFPDTFVYLASARFANSFKINLMDAYLALS